MAALVAALFKKPISSSYLLAAVFLIVTGVAVAFSDSPLPEITKHLAMMATMVGTARLFNPLPMRWVWAGVVATLGLAPRLSVSGVGSSGSTPRHQRLPRPT